MTSTLLWGTLIMKYVVKIKRKTERNLEKLPQRVQDLLHQLVEDLKEYGPSQSSWPNYGKLNENEYHCHLTHRYVACWRYEKGNIILEVYYVGSRENAPY